MQKFNSEKLAVSWALRFRPSGYVIMQGSDGYIVVTPNEESHWVRFGYQTVNSK